MRLRVLDSGHRLRGRMFFWLMRAVAGTEDAVAKTSLYRPSFFGRALLRFIRSAMRGPSDWSAGERELFAALVSRLNSCPFCVSVHVGITALALNPTITAEQLDHWRDIGLRSQVARNARIPGEAHASSRSSRRRRCTAPARGRGFRSGDR